MNYILNFCIGILIGAGAILPGISSGVLCVIFGIYEKLVNSVLNFFKDTKNNFKFLFPIASGSFVGIIALGNVLKFLFTTFPTPTKFAFIGLIVGEVPILCKKANKDVGFRLTYMLYLIATFAVAVLLIFIENKCNINFLSIENSNFFYLVLCGFLMSIGIVVPGVSSSVILILLGIYNIYLDSISTLYLPVLFPLGIGVIIGGLVFLNLIKYLLDYYYTKTFYCIIGFIIGSVLVLIPSFNLNFEGIISIGLFIICFCLALNFEKLEEK